MKKTVKIIKTGEGCGIIIPKVMAELLEAKIGGKIELEYDFKKKEITLKVVE